MSTISHWNEEQSERLSSLRYGPTSTVARWCCSRARAGRTLLEETGEYEGLRDFSSLQLGLDPPGGVSVPFSSACLCWMALLERPGILIFFYFFKSNIAED